jgi:4-hydroxy-tetrahydrodipicolinate reductase
MNIAIIGYGKMGKAIEEIALQRGHTVLLKIDMDNLELLNGPAVNSCDVAIEFTGPESAAGNISKCFDAGLPVVCGSTGWLQQWDEVVSRAAQKNSGFLYASNFSIGVNIFFELNKALAGLMNKQKEYEVTVEEIHHTAKKDAPSGTAITLAEQIIATGPTKNTWINTVTQNPHELSIISKREDPAPGTHIIHYYSEVDEIEIKHTAHSRKGFALGAVMAAEFMQDKKGIYSMKEVLGF